MSTTATGSSQNGGGASSTKTNGGASHQSPPRAPSAIQVIQGDIKLEQIQLQDREEEASEDEASKVEKLLRVQWEIDRHHQEQESILRRKATVQHDEAQRQHINRQRARLVEL
jgi:hypothetical protein